MWSTILLFASSSFAGKLEIAGLARLGPPARDFDSFYLDGGVGGIPLGAEVAWAGHQRGDRFGFRPGVMLEGWARLWNDVSTDQVWGREVGVRLEPRLAVRWVASPDWLWSRQFTVSATVDVGVGAAFVLFADGPFGFGAFSPTLSARPALHLGRYEPLILALDMRVGIHGRLEGCYPGRDHCPDTQLNPGGTSLGLLIGHTL